MKELEIMCGASIDDAYKQMKNYEIKSGEHCFCMFNEKKLLSTFTLDECYKEVTGCTKKEWEDKARKEQEEYERKEAEFKASIPDKIALYRDKARGVIPEYKLEEWDRIVPVRLNDLYHGMELDCWIELSKILNEDIPEKDKLEKAKKAFYDQGHSGMSASLVLAGLKLFHPLGSKFVSYVEW